MIETLPSGIRLKNLIQDHHAEILGREKNNDKFVHLYSIGTYWVAFERSACQLSDMFPQCEITLFQVGDFPDYVIMASTPSDEVVTYFRKHIVCCDKSDYKVLVVPSLPAKYYYRWHVNVVKSILQ